MREAVQALDRHLHQLQQLGQGANPNVEAIQGQFLAAQQQFQTDILPLGAAGDLPLQPILTEMNRTFRLLAMDVAFLQTVRQPLKAQQRQRQLLEKLQQLSSFCQALTQAIAAASEALPPEEA